MINVEVFNILSGNDIDLIVPFAVKRKKFFELLLLNRGEIGEVFENDADVLHGKEFGWKANGFNTKTQRECTPRHQINVICLWLEACSLQPEFERFGKVN